MLGKGKAFLLIGALLIQLGCANQRRVTSQKTAVTRPSTEVSTGMVSKQPSAIDSKVTKDLTKNDLLDTLDTLVVETAQKYNPKLKQVFMKPEDKMIMEYTFDKQGHVKSYFCFCVNVVAPDHIEYNGDLPWEENVQHNQFGCFLTPKAKPVRLIALGFFPTGRWLDYTAYCGAAQQDVITIYAHGETYGDQGQQRKYKVDFELGRAEKISEGAYDPGYAPH